MSSLRLFIAVDPSPENVAAFDEAIANLRPLAPRARWVRAEKLHVTLVFLGETNEINRAPIEDALFVAAEKHEPFTLRFEKAGTFGSPNRPRVLWAGLDGDLQALVALQNELSVGLGPLGYAPEYRSFVPHLTLARAADQQGDTKLSICAEKISNLSFGTTTIRDVVLYHSETTNQGTFYHALCRAPLRS